MPLTLVFVFCKSEIIRSAALLNHLPHLIGEFNARSEEPVVVKLVRLPEGARNALSEFGEVGTYDAFAVQVCLAPPYLMSVFFKTYYSGSKMNAKWSDYGVF